MHPNPQGIGKTTIAQMAELVDALVSNTNAFGRAGSTPALGTKIKLLLFQKELFLFNAGGEVYPDAAERISGTPALGTKNPFRCEFGGVFAFFGKPFQKINFLWSGEIRHSSGKRLQKPDRKRLIADSF